MLKKKQKQQIISKAQTHEKDTGSSEVQVAMLEKRIDELAKHLKKNRKDNHSRRGLLQLVAKRRKHEKFLASKKPRKTA